MKLQATNRAARDRVIGLLNGGGGLLMADDFGHMVSRVSSSAAVSPSFPEVAAASAERLDQKDI